MEAQIVKAHLPACVSFDVGSFILTAPHKRNCMLHVPVQRKGESEEKDTEMTSLLTDLGRLLAAQAKQHGSLTSVDCQGRTSCPADGVIEHLTVVSHQCPHNLH